MSFRGGDSRLAAPPIVALTVVALTASAISLKALPDDLAPLPGQETSYVPRA